MGVAYKDANYLNDKNAAVNNFYEKLGLLEQKIVTLKSSYENLRLIHDLSEIDLKPINMKLNEIKKSIATEEFEQSLVGDLAKLLDSANRNMMLIWKKIIHEETKSVDNVINTLGTIVSGRDEITNLKKEKQKFINSTPGNLEARRAIEAYKNIFQDLISELDFDDEILTFLSKISGKRKLTLKDMNLNVYNWLTKNGFAKKVNITL